MLKVALYARVSTDDKNQDPETQLFALRKFCADAGWEIHREYVDHARAKDYKARTAWAELLSDARMYRFNVVLVWKLDRAFRSVRECTNILEEWDGRGIKFRSLTQDSIDTTTSMGKFVLHILAAAAELESSLIADRVTAGIARVRSEGKRWGRKRVNIDIPLLESCFQQSGTVRGAVRLYEKQTGKSLNPGTAHGYLKAGK